MGLCACKPQVQTVYAPCPQATPSDCPAAPVAEQTASGPTPAAPPANVPQALVDAAQKIAAHVQSGSINGRAYNRLAELVDRFGHRLSGSQALEDAIAWTLVQMQQDGLVNVRKEKVMVPHWVRGKESAAILAPVKRPLTPLGLGGTVGTGKRPIRAEIVVVPDLEALERRGSEVAGKIVVINQAMPPYDHEKRDTHYGATVQIRVRGASIAAKHGAKAVLIRSVTAHSLNSPHTGSLRYEDGIKKIPAAAVTVEDADRLQRMAARGPVKVELSLGAKTLPDAESGNAIGEIRGRELPDEVVVVGCHIDSWDVGDGASDDGAGCVMAMEAGRILQELGLTPRRTVRVVLYTNEENGLRGAKAYHEAHGKQVHAGAIEADVGAGAPAGFGITGTPEQVAQLQQMAALFEPLGASDLHEGGGGADISPLTKDGVLSIGLHPDVSHYFDLHHSPADTIDKIDPDHLQRNAAAMALMAFILAER